MSAGIRVLVCGGRAFSDRALIDDVLDRLHRERTIALIIEGGAAGADALANRWAKSRGVPVETHIARWRLYGKAAGPLRNAAMLEKGKPDLVVAFPGGRGTADMVGRAIRAGVPIDESACDVVTTLPGNFARGPGGGLFGGA